MTHGIKVEEGSHCVFDAEQLEALVREGRQVLRCLLHQDIAELIYLEHPHEPGAAERWRAAVSQSHEASESFDRWYYEAVAQRDTGLPSPPLPPACLLEESAG